MRNLTNKDLQRMRELMGNRKPINESKSLSTVELIKKSPNGKYYGVIRENKKYFIKESNDGSNFDFIGGVGNKTKNQFESYEQAVRRLNLMLESSDVLTPDLIEEKKFVIKTKKKSEPKSTDTFDFGGDKGEEEIPDFNLGGNESDKELDFGDDFEDNESDKELDFGGDSEEDLSDKDDPIKSIQKMTGKLGQKIRDTEDLSSDTMKWVAKSILSALDLEGMDNEDKKDLIRTIKNDKVGGSDEEFDFMEDEDCVNCSGSGFDNDMEKCVNCGGTGEIESDMIDWNKLNPNEKNKFIQNMFLDDSEKPMMDWDEEVDSEEDYIEDEEELYGPGNERIEQGEKLLNDQLPYYEDENQQDYFDNEDWMSDDETYPYYEVGSNTDYMSKFAGNVKRGLSSGGRNLEKHELDTHLRKIKNKLGGKTTHIDNNMVVGPFGFVKVTNKGYELYKEGERFPRIFKFNELGKLKNALSGIDYMDDEYYGKFERQNTKEWHSSKDKIGNLEYDDEAYDEEVFPDYESYSKSPYDHPGWPFGYHTKKSKSGNDEQREYHRKMAEKFFNMYKDEYGPFKVRKKKPVNFDETTDMFKQDGIDYMDDVSNPAPAPTKPDTKPDVKPSKPGTDKPSPSKRPFTPPPYITPGEEPAPKAKDKWGRNKPYDERYVDYRYEYPEGEYDYMEDKNSCPTCQGKGYLRKPIGFGKVTTPSCIDCGGTGRNQKFVGDQPNISSEDEIDEPYINNLFGYQSNSTLPNGLDYNYKYKEKLPFPIRNIDYMDDFNDISYVNKRIMNPAPAPTKPDTKPDVKPGKPGTDKPSPSKRPFTPPPYITPGEEPAPKARNRRF